MSYPQGDPSTKTGERAKNGGVQGEEIFCPRAVVPPPALQRGAEQKILLFLIEKFLGGARNQKM